MVRFRVGIGQHEHRSEDGGRNWSRQMREVLSRNTPVVHGSLDLGRLPSLSGDMYWDFVTQLPCGFGVAVGHQAVAGTDSLAFVFITMDNGGHWHKRDANPRLPPLRRCSWPVDRFQSLALPSRDLIAVSWDDPWLLDGAESHVISSKDQGESWNYHCLGYTNPYLAVDYEGRLLALNDGYYLESRDGGKRREKSDFQIDWPEGQDNKHVALLRQVVFSAPGVGYALVVHWPTVLRKEASPSVGLLTSNDNGIHWRHLHVFDGPNIGDINERHILELCVT